ncbi:MAG: ABC transporter permease, partial [Longimicrobiales bacterium]
MTASRRPPLWLRCVALLVPAPERADWCEEWIGELAALDRDDASLGRRLRFALGSVPHALSLRGVRRGGGGGSDLRYALRTLVRRPRFTVVAALTLALGIAVNGALFSLVDGLLLREPVAVDNPGELVRLARSYDDAPRWDNFSWPALEALRDADHLFAGVAGSTVRSFVLGEGAAAEVAAGAYVTGDWFEVLGVRPAAGRLIQRADDEPDAPPVVVVSHGLWTRLFGRDPGAVGSTLHLGGRPHLVVGVAPAGFTGIDKLGAAPELFVPTATLPPLGIPGLTVRSAWGFSWIDVVARLQPERTAAAARASLDAVSMAMREADGDDSELRVLLSEGVGLSPAEREEAVRLGWLMAVVSGLVLVLTCANVAGLFLARAVDRRAEFSVRRTLGAGGARIARQLLTESALLAVLATALAAPLLLAVGEHLGRIVPASVAISFAPDHRVWLALVGLGLGAGLLFGGVPAVLVARRSPARGLRSGRGTPGSRGTNRVRNALVVGQLAVSLGLLAGAGLLVRSVGAALDARPGLDPTGVLAAPLDLGLTGRYDDPAARTAFLGRLVAAAEERP